MRRLAFILALVAVTGTALAVTSAGADDKKTYQVELYNAFGIVSGSEVRIAGVLAGTVEDLDINQDKRAVVTIELSGPLSDLREDASCSAQPQSLIAEYFVDCQPGRSDTELDPDEPIPAERNQTTVQNDLVTNVLREPFKARFALIFNEFGTGLAGNADALNTAIRNGAPALQALNQALAILARQNTTIRDLNENSDTIVARLNDRSEDVIRFLEEARDTSVASAARREDLARDFELLPGFLAELEPTLAALGRAADQQTPLLTDLRAVAPELLRLTNTLPPFNDASIPVIESTGDAALPGRRALVAGRDEIRALRQASIRAFSVADQLANFLVDLDDPRRGVERDLRAPPVTGRNAPRYTGLEGLLNYVYYQTLAINQYDQIGHLLHFILFEFEAGPCGSYNAEDHVPAAGGGTTTRFSGKHGCVAWLGPSQPGINNINSFPIRPYHPSVCPQGSNEPEICSPAAPRNPPTRELTAVPAASETGQSGEGAGGEGGQGSGGEDPGRGPDPGEGDLPETPLLPGIYGLPEIPGLGGLGGLLGIDGAEDRGALGDLLGRPRRGRGNPGATQDLMNFLFGS